MEGTDALAIVEIASEVEKISTSDACHLPYAEGELLLFVSGAAY